MAFQTNMKCQLILLCFGTMFIAVSLGLNATGPSDNYEFERDASITLYCILWDFGGGEGGKWSIIHEGVEEEQIKIIWADGQVDPGANFNETIHGDWNVDTTDTHHFDLQIPSIKINDEGCYFCGLSTAQLDDMRGECGNVTTVVIANISLEINDDDDGNLVEGGVYEVECKVNARPAARLSLKFDDAVVETNDTTPPKGDGTYDTMVLYPYSPLLNDNDKSFECLAIQGDDVYDKKLPITVIQLGGSVPCSQLWWCLLLIILAVLTVCGIVIGVIVFLCKRSKKGNEDQAGKQTSGDNQGNTEMVPPT